ncbi:enoyl-CoA hydratase/isomerase family protein [Litorivivens sp.]|uniref:enoyl-CoA hydratase/isomerase family protein n=1 Tax=Litorivivens sp. TaxID=2020868 RepID=UPI00356B3B62
MTGAAPLLFERYGHVALITLNRPEALNAFTGDMGELWSERYRECDRDDSIRAVVVTGNDRAFCAGADMSGGADTFDTHDSANFSSSPVLPAWKVRKPVIAAMNGHAIGLGFSLALQCDFRFAATDSKYGLIQSRRGVLADGCSHWLLPRLIGVEAAMEMLVLGRTLTSDELAEKGLAREILPAAQVLPAALSFADEIASQSSPLIAAMSKRLLWDGLGMSLDAMDAKESQWLQHTMGKADAIEGGRAFAERRAPRWQSQVNSDWPEG